MGHGHGKRKGKKKLTTMGREEVCERENEGYLCSPLFSLWYEDAAQQKASSQKKTVPAMARLLRLWVLSIYV